MMLPNNPPRQSSNSCPRHQLKSTQTRRSTISCIHNDTIKGKCSNGGLCFAVWKAVVMPRRLALLVNELFDEAFVSKSQRKRVKSKGESNNAIG
eukprot:scaffold71750_cov42-Cyclotella_meneghiniana.AAC.1